MQALTCRCDTKARVQSRNAVTITNKDTGKRCPELGAEWCQVHWDCREPGCRAPLTAVPLPSPAEAVPAALGPALGTTDMGSADRTIQRCPPAQRDSDLAQDQALLSGCHKKELSKPPTGLSLKKSQTQAGKTLLVVQFHWDYEK